MQVPLQRQPQAALGYRLAQGILAMPARWIFFVPLRCVTLSGWGRTHDALPMPAHRIAGWGLVALAAAGTIAALVLLFGLL